MSKRATPKNCAECGLSFTKDPRNTHKYWETRAKFCSKECTGKHRTASKPILDRETVFRTWFDPSVDGCWPWKGAQDKDGYGIFAFDGKTARAHRVALVLSGVDVPKGGLVCHTCDNPSCVNPAHLYFGSNRQNSDDKMNRGRSVKGARHYAAKLTDADVIAIRSMDGTHVSIAAMFGISHSNVTMIRQRKTWKHLP